MKYDVFISCKSEDYGLARNVYAFLVERGFCVFLADAELRKKANAEYGKVIDSALDSAKHFILVTSKKEFVESSYVESEWRTFLEEKRTGRKRGNFLTILKGIDVSLLPISLRKFQSFPYSDYLNIIDYLPICDQSTSKLFIKIPQDVPTPQKTINNQYRKMIFFVSVILCIFIIVLIINNWENPMSGEDINTDTLSLPIGNRILGNIRINNGEYREIKNENNKVKEIYLEVLCSEYQKHGKGMDPHIFYDQKMSKCPSVCKIVSVKEFIRKVFE